MLALRDGANGAQAHPFPNRTERHVSFEQNTAGARLTPDDAEPLQWPVLARLPHVGRAQPPALAPAASSALEVLNRRQTTQWRGDSAAIAPPATISQPYAPQAAAPQAYEWPELDRAAPTAPPTALPRREYRRIDAADDHHAPRAHAPQPKDPLAARVYQWHAALAPHAGVAVTVALILSATLLYWLTLGQQRATFGPDNLLDQQSIWSSEMPAGAPLGGGVAASQWKPSATPAEPAPAAPRVADADLPRAEAIPSSPAPSVAARADTAPQRSTTTPVEDHAAAEAPAPTLAETPTHEEEPITPTPEAAPYPVTDYVEFNFADPFDPEPTVAADPAAENRAAAP